MKSAAARRAPLPHGQPQFHRRGRARRPDAARLLRLDDHRQRRVHAARHRVRCRHGLGPRAAVGAAGRGGAARGGHRPRRGHRHHRQPHALLPCGQPLSRPFPRARYHLQTEEMAHCTGSAMCHAAIRATYEAADVQAMIGKLFTGRVVYHDGTAGIRRRASRSDRVGGRYARPAGGARAHSPRLGGAGRGRGAFLCQLAPAPTVSHRGQRARSPRMPSASSSRSPAPRSTSFRATTRWSWPATPRRRRAWPNAVRVICPHCGPFRRIAGPER